MERECELTEYMSKACEFFSTYRWVYDFKGTCVLTDAVMNAVPLPFQEYFKQLLPNTDEFQKIIHLQSQNHWPPDLKRFIEECRVLKHLAHKYQKTVEPRNSVLNTNNLPRKWNPKKYSEVVHVGDFVGSKFKEHGCDGVVDIGSGLGYLSHHLASNFGLRVQAVEADSSRVNKCKESLPESCSASVSFHCLRITENIYQELTPIVRNLKNIGITALHACGDLTPWSLKYFVNNPDMKVLGIVSCCYHKMSTTEAGNFPLSKCLTSILDSYKDASFLKNQWLWRLGCQRSGSQFLNNIDRETSHHFYRAVIERVCLQESLSLKKRKRNLSDIPDTFGEYLECMLGEGGAFHFLRNGEIISDTQVLKLRQTLEETYEQLHTWTRILTGILALQGAIQEISESTILIDRLAFIRESSDITESGILKVIPDHVTPRGNVLFAVKQKQ